MVGEKANASFDFAQVRQFLIQSGLVGSAEVLRHEPLTGGVASDIWKVSAGQRALVVKRALPRLKVAQHWEVPVSRNAAEAAWLLLARLVVPEAVPAVLAHDAEAGLFAMEYLAPGTHPVWKTL